MSTSTAQTLTTDGIETLRGVIEVGLPAILPTLIVVTFLFGVIFVLKKLWHRRV